VSRVVYDDEATWLDHGRWEHNLRRTIKSKRGQQVLRDLRAALLALPAPRLIDGYMLAPSDPGCPDDVCLLGALARSQRVPLPVGVMHDSLREQPLDRWGLPPERWAIDETAEWASAAMGMSRTLAWALIEVNDENVWAWRTTETPEQRYRRVLGWVTERIEEDQ